MPKATRLSHVHLKVSDLERSIRFYESAFGLKHEYSDEMDGVVLAFLVVAGSKDVLTLQGGGGGPAGEMGGFEHFGFQVPAQLEDTIAAVGQHGGAFVEYAGWEPEHVAYVRDPDGYVIEIDARPRSSSAPPDI